MKPFDTTKPTVSLSATKEEICALLAAGQPVVFPKGEADQRVIDAEWIEELGGKDGTLTVPIRIANAVIRSPLRMPYAVFKSLVSIVECEFADEIDIRGSRFERAFILRGSTFRATVNFAQIDVAYDLRLIAATFDGTLKLDDARIGQLFTAPGATFRGDASFIRLKVEKAAFFIPIIRDQTVVPTRFEKLASFIDAQFSVTAEFDGAQFEGQAKFMRACFGAEAFFRPARYAFPLDSMERVEVPGKPQHVVFRGEADFGDADFGGTAIFNEAEFKAKADFMRITVAHDALFEGTQFHGSVSMRGAAIGADLHLQGSRMHELEMRRATVTGKLRLAGAAIQMLDLRRSRMALLSFTEAQSREDETFAGRIDFREASFERLEGDWRKFLGHLQPFTRDAYECVERFLRTSDEERDARNVYFDRRVKEGRQLRDRVGNHQRRGHHWQALRATGPVVVDLFERFVAGYGVRSMRLFVIMLVVLGLGSVVFTFDDALEMKTSPQSAASVTPRPACKEEAIVYSVALAIPLVQLPPIERWRPTNKPILRMCGYKTITYETFSAIYRLLGFLLVPLAFAVVSGLLYRRDRA